MSTTTYTCENKTQIITVSEWHPETERNYKETWRGAKCFGETIRRISEAATEGSHGRNSIQVSWWTLWMWRPGNITLVAWRKEQTQEFPPGLENLKIWTDRFPVRKTVRDNGHRSEFLEKEGDVIFQHKSEHCDVCVSWVHDARMINNLLHLQEKFRQGETTEAGTDARKIGCGHSLVATGSWKSGKPDDLTSGKGNFTEENINFSLNGRNSDVTFCPSMDSQNESCLKSRCDTHQLVECDLFSLDS